MEMPDRLLLTVLAALWTSCAVRPKLPVPEPCPAPAVDTAGWQEIDELDFSFAMPAEFRELSVRPIDSHVRVWRAGRSRVHFDYGWYSPALELRGDEIGYTACGAQIGGKTARLATFWHPSLDYFAGAHWTVREGNDPERFKDLRPTVYLTLYVTSPNRADLERLKAILWTTTFTDANAP